MKKNIAVIFGGRSAEHDVSIITAHSPIISSLLTMPNVRVIPIYITKKGDWYSESAMKKIEYFKNPNYEEKLAKLKKIQLKFDDGLTIVHPGLFPKETKIDVAFPAMHGTYGEDGSLMGLLRMANVPFVGCDLFASTLSMDKALTKEILKAHEVPTVPHVVFTKQDWQGQKKSILNAIDSLEFPVFVKPTHLGSSIGISKIKDKTQTQALQDAIDVAVHYDDKVLVEEGVKNLIEVTLPIMGNESPTLASVERPLNQADFFDFNEKYISADSKKTNDSQGVNREYSEIPADINSKLIEETKRLGELTYKILGCSGIARVDFLIDSVSGKVYVNEVNTLPGSLYQHNWRKSGVSNIELVSKLIELAEDRFSDQQNVTYDFNSNILSQAGGKKIEG